MLMTPITPKVIASPIADSSNTEPRQITESPTQDRYPCWSPDGQSVAFLREWMKSDGDWVHNIFVTSFDGGAPRQVISESDRVGYTSIDWSPDGSRFAFTAGFGGESELWLMEDFLHLLKR